MSILDLSQVLADLQQALAFTDVQLARALGVDTREVRRWYSGAHFPQGRSRARLNELRQLADRLDETFSSAEAAHTWLHTDSRYLGLVKPAEVLQIGRIDRVNAALEAIDSGYIS